jgi:hypothetical protein
VKTVHEFFTNLRRMDDSRFEYSWFHSWMVSCIADVVSSPVETSSRDGRRYSAFEPRRLRLGVRAAGVLQEALDGWQARTA